MKDLFKHIILLGYLLISANAFSQDKDSQNQLALLYYSKGEFKKAAGIYETLYSQSRSAVHFDYLLNCYTNLGMFDEAIKISKRQIKYFPDKYLYKVGLAYLLEQQGIQKDADDIHSNIKKKAVKSQSTSIEAVDAYIEFNMNNRALEILQICKKQYPKHLDFSKQICKIFLQNGNYESLVKEYMDILSVHEHEVDFVQNQLQFVIYEEEITELKDKMYEALYERLNKHPNNSPANELLIWLYAQDKNFNEAFILAKAYSLRENDGGEKVFEIGKSAQNNEDYEAASKAYTFIISKGKNNDFFTPALKSLVQTSEEKIFSSGQVSKQNLISLENEYINAINTLGKNSNTADVARALAHLQAFYLSKKDEAINLLQDFIENPSVHKREKSFCELKLADIQVLNNDVWLANILYAKIVLENKNNEVGFEAKLKQAKLAYYNKQFEYAQALLDVLKASTSKLISNDAFELSHLISDNSALDTTTVALELFSEADLCIYQKNYLQASNLLDSLTKKFPAHSLEDEVLFRKAEIAKQTQDTTKMISYLTEITERFSHDILADNAHFMLANYYETNNNLELSKKHYEEIIFNFPTSFFVNEARKRYRSLSEQ